MKLAMYRLSSMEKKALRQKKTTAATAIIAYGFWTPETAK
jgi:hypothetical protein